MTIDLSRETQKLLDTRLKKGGYSDPDALVRFALEMLEEAEGDPFEDFDQATQAAIKRAEAQSARGEGRPWREVKEELRMRFVKR